MKNSDTKTVIETKAPVLVTGATGYLAGWIVCQLLEQGRTVHAAVRDPENARKLAPLRALESESPGRLRFFKSDLLDEGSYAEAMAGCEVVFHTASPFALSVENPQRDLVDPALLGTRNVLEEATRTPSVQRVVVTSSYLAAIGDNADLAESGRTKLTEESWNTTSSLTHQPYAYSKTLAEREAWRIAEAQHQWKLVTINPAFIMGPGIDSHATSESFHQMKNLGTGKLATGVPNYGMAYVDVRDVAAAHLAAAFLPGAAGRYLVSAESSDFPALAATLRESFGKAYPFPKGTVPKPLAWLIAPLLDKAMTRKIIARNVNHALVIDAEKGRRELGLSYRSFPDTIREMFQQMITAGIVSPR